MTATIEDKVTELRLFTCDLLVNGAHRMLNRMDDRPAKPSDKALSKRLQNQIDAASHMRDRIENGEDVSDSPALPAINQASLIVLDLMKDKPKDPEMELAHRIYIKGELAQAMNPKPAPPVVTAPAPVTVAAQRSYTPTPEPQPSTRQTPRSMEAKVSPLDATDAALANYRAVMSTTMGAAITLDDGRALGLDARQAQAAGKLLDNLGASHWHVMQHPVNGPRLLQELGVNVPMKELAAALWRSDASLRANHPNEAHYAANALARWQGRARY